MDVDQQQPSSSTSNNMMSAGKRGCSANECVAASKQTCPHCLRICRPRDRYCWYCGRKLFRYFSELSKEEQALISKKHEEIIDRFLEFHSRP